MTEHSSTRSLSECIGTDAERKDVGRGQSCGTLLLSSVSIAYTHLTSVAQCMFSEL